MKQLTNTDLILNNNGSIYHLGLHAEQIYSTIITVGDPGRVDSVSRHFDFIDYTNHNREFKAVGGRIGNIPIMVLSTGIGTDNIDIVLNELSMLINYDLSTRKRTQNQKLIRIIRLGTSGSIHPTIPLDSIVYSKNAIALDNLLTYYNHSFDLIEFNGMQLPLIPGRSKFRPSQLPPKFDLLDFNLIDFNGNQPGNIEMETAGIYGLSKLLGFEAISLNAILADRRKGEFSKKPQQMIDKMIEEALEILCK